MGFVICIFNGAYANCQEIFPIPTHNLILFSRQGKVYAMEKLTAKQNKVARLIQKDITVVDSPFMETGKACGLTAREVLDTTKELLEKGFIRKFCAILRHQKAGYEENALVLWSVPSDQVEKAGKMLSAYGSVSHCYERNPAFRKKYNIFTMLHSKDEDILSLISDIASATGINDYLILESIQEYKKKSPEYF
jgi:DNA-binding Lrp family transcriptional regulator